MKELLVSLLSLTLVLLIGCQSDRVALHGNENSVFENRVEAYLKSQANNNRFNGVALIVKNDSVMAEKTIGFAERTSEIPFSDSSIFLIGSITKTFTAAAILQLVDNEQLSLNDSLLLFFPDFPRANEVRVKQLLMHTSGIRDYHEFENWRFESQRKSLIPFDVIDSIKKNPFRYEPGERFSYSNSGYILLGLIIEQVTGLSFAEYVKQNICDPLKLSKTGVCVNGQEPPHLVKGYRTNPTGSYDTEWINYQQPFSSGNMYSTLGDLKRFTEAVFKAELFSAVILDKLKNDNSGKYGFGWGIRNVDSNRFYGHVGAMNGFVGGINYLPEEDLFIGYLTNDDNTSRYSISSSLTQLALGNDVPPVNKRTYKALSSDSLLDYAGNYLIKPGDTLKVFTKEKQLILQETGQAPQQLFCFGKHQFDFEQLEFDVRFNINNGVVADSLFFERKGNSFLRAARIN